MIDQLFFSKQMKETGKLYINMIFICINCSKGFKSSILRWLAHCQRMEEGIMANDYEQVAFYVLHSKWDELFFLMLRTEDDLLAKKIRLFLHEYHFSIDQGLIVEYYDNLIAYTEHATKILV